MLDVLPLDESHGRIDDSPFINAIVKIALSAVGYIYSLQNKAVTQFDHFAEQIAIPFNTGIQQHPAYSGYQLSMRHFRPSHSIRKFANRNKFLSWRSCLVLENIIILCCKRRSWGSASIQLKLQYVSNMYRICIAYLSHRMALLLNSFTWMPGCCC